MPLETLIWMTFRKKSEILSLALLLVAASPLLAGAQEGFDPELEDEPAAGATPSAPSSATNTNTDTRVEPKPEPVPEVKPEPRPVAPARQAPHSERGPADIQTYIKEGRTPKFIRINVRGQNLRSSADFSVKRTDNITGKTAAGDLYNVESVKAMQYGSAVEVNIDGQSRWIYVSHARKSDFQVCESEACMSSLADSLDFFLHGTGVTVNQAESCGVSSGPEGLVLPQGAPAPSREPEPMIRPAARPATPVNPPAQTALSVKPLWETARGAQGAQWTRLASAALDKYGQGLLNQRNISDARTFCPNFSRLTPAQKKEFFIHLMNGISRYESNFKTSVPVFDEDRYKNRTPPYNIYRGPIKPNSYSMGLFQLSYSAAPGYRPQCGIDWNKDRGKDISDPSLTIYDPKIQMECAVTILNKWITTDGGVGYTRDVRTSRGTRFRGGANYWSTLRNTNPATQNVIASLKRFTPCWR